MTPIKTPPAGRGKLPMASRFSMDTVTAQPEIIQNKIGQAPRSSPASWAERAPELADWAMSLVNRDDVWGVYLNFGSRKERTQKDGTIKIDTALTAPPKDQRGKRRLNRDVIIRHFAGRSVGDLIGLHAIAIQRTCKWLAIDIDQHDDADTDRAESNLSLALEICDRLEAMGLRPLLEDSNGRGGFHIWVILRDSIPSADAYAFVKSIIGNHVIEVYPKQETVDDEDKKFGNWLRLPGRHHTYDHFTRIYDRDGGWLESDSAIDEILSRTGDDPQIILNNLPQQDAPQFQSAPVKTETIQSDEDLAVKCIDHLASTRADNYHDWLGVGMAAHSVNGGGGMLAAWDRFSQKSGKYVEGECAAKWKTFNGNGGLTLGSLIEWARRDSGFSPLKERGRNGNATEPDESPTPTFISARTLCADHPELNPIILDGLLRERETGNAISVSKGNKSWLMLQLAICIASGRMFLGKFAVRRGDVLILDNELHLSTLGYRLPKVAAALGASMDEIADHICIESLRGRLRDIHALAPYFNSIEPGRFKLVILDALYRLLPVGCDENSNADMAQVYNSIDRYSEHLGCAFFLVHHGSKGNQSAKAVTDVGSGAGAQSRACDTHFVLRPHQEDGAVVVDAAVRSFAPVQPFCLRWQFPIWTPADDLDPALLRDGRPRRKADAAEPETPAEPWTPERFVKSFLAVDARSESSIYTAADVAGLSERKAKRLLTAALDAGTAHRWTFGNRKIPHRFATIEQPVTATTGGES
jgi:hypothetical protein